MKRFLTDLGLDELAFLVVRPYTSVRILRAGGISPSAMVTLFDKLAEKRRASKAKAQQDEKDGKDEKARTAHWLGIAFASHPADAERVRFFQEAAKGR